MKVSQRLVRGYVVCALALCAAYLAVPRSQAAQVLFVVIAASAPAVGAIAVRRDRSGTRLGSLLLVSGLGLAALGEVYDLVLITFHVRPDSGTIIDVIFLTAYVVQLFGLMSLFRSQAVSRHQFGWFDTVMIGVAVMTIVWSTMYDTIFGNHASALDLLTRFGGAVLGVALAVMALRLVLASRGANRGWNLLLAALLLQVATDSAAALWKDYAAGSRLDTLWAVGYVLMGAALLHTGSANVVTRGATRLAHQEIKHTLVLQAAVTIGLAGIIVVQVGDAAPLPSLVVWGCSWLMILVLTRVRIYALLQLVGKASATESERRLTAMVDSSNDVIGLADPDGTIRYMTPSIARLVDVPVGEWVGQRFDVALSRHIDGLHDLAARCALLGPGESATWEGTAGPEGAAPTRTLQLTLANQTGTPEVNGWVITAHDVTDQARLTSELRHQSMHDTLTGLPNRGLLFDRIQHSIDRMSRLPDACLSVVLVDIDDFKAVNDSLGHTTGDELLRAVAERLSSSVRQGDTVARLGGDEFALLFEDTGEDEAMQLANRALESLAMPVHIETGDFAVRASAGVVCQRGVADPVELLRSADIAMYASKRGGKSKVTIFETSMHEIAREHLELRMELASALERDEFAVVYQPIVDTQTERICGVEALLRWNNPRRGSVSPVEFIPIAEQAGHIGPIGSWVMATACAEASTWTGAGEHAYVSVNVSAPQLHDVRFVQKVEDTLAASGLEPKRLMLEITESMLVDDTSSARTTLNRLRALGIRIAIDDFGTGYSSLSYLRSLSADVVKIDQSFVRDVDDIADNQALTRTILALADGLDMTAIAEGVETTTEHAELARMGCAFVQGFLFSRPVAAAALHALFETATDDAGLGRS